MFCDWDRGSISFQVPASPLPLSLSLSLPLSARHQFRAAEKTKNTAQQLDRTPTTVYKPRAQQKEYVSLLLCSVSDTVRLYIPGTSFKKEMVGEQGWPNMSEPV